MSLLTHMERWRDVEGFEGLYMVSTLGRVKSLGNGKANNPMLSKERILNPSKDKDGYLQVKLSKDGKKITKKVHRLVAKAFIPNPNNFQEVNHKDENKENNCVENLEWCDRKYNNNYGTSIKRRAEKHYKKVFCVETETIFSSIIEAEKQTGIYSQNISACCKGKIKTAGKFNWRYID